MDRISFRTWTIPLALLLLCLISFGTMLSKLHFYWDDWTIVYYIHFLGPSSFHEAFAVDRPLMGGIYQFITSLLGESSLRWQIFALLMRWVSCLALWVTLKGLWPNNVLQITAVTMLFAVYPGFNQQYIAITYGNAFFFYALFLVSMGMMIWAFRIPRWFWPLYLSSILLSGYTMFLVEYFFGLELLRPLLLWMILEKSDQTRIQRARRIASYWLPYLVPMILFLVWRISTPTPRAEIEIFDQLAVAPLGAIRNLFGTVLADIYKASVGAWMQVFNFSPITHSQANVIVRYLGITLLGALFSLIFFLSLQNAKIETPGDKTLHRNQWALQAIVIGSFSLLVAGIPVWMTNLRMELFFPWDRFTLPMMPGASLLTVGSITLLASKKIINVILISIVIGLATGLHFQRALDFRKEWLQVRDFFWQLTWRAPGIQPGTLILAPELPFEYNWDNSLTAPLNWIYAPENTERALPYLLYNLETRLSKGLPNLKEDAPILEQHRITPFNGTTSQAIALTFQPPACLKVIDPVSDQHLPHKPRYFHEALRFSNLDLILPNVAVPATPPEHLLGSEPAHDWCYYYQKAELARQEADWDEVVRLGDEALKLRQKFFKTNVAELTPFIEGYAQKGRWEEALHLSLTAFQSWKNMDQMLCELWDQISQSAPLDQKGQAAYQEMIQTLKCKHP